MNPLVIHQFLKAQSLRRTKTDKADSLTIANYLMSVPYKPNSDILYNIFTLKSLCRSREQLIKERSKYQVLLTNQLDLTFPELKSFLDNRISTTLLFILEKYTNTEHISLMRDYDSIRCISRGKFSYSKFAKLKELAKNSVGHHDENTDLLKWWQKQIWALRKIKNDRSGLNEIQISLLKELTKIIPTKVLLQWE